MAGLLDQLSLFYASGAASDIGSLSIAGNGLDGEMVMGNEIFYPFLLFIIQLLNCLFIAPRGYRKLTIPLGYTSLGMIIMVNIMTWFK